MAEFTGQNLSVKWIYSGGTVDLSGDYRSLSYKPTIGMVKSTAGSDSFDSYLATTKEVKVDYTGVFQTGGTALEDALLPGTSGTLIVGPEGTASGKRKYTVPALSQGGNFAFKFQDVVEIANGFQSTGTVLTGTF